MTLTKIPRSVRPQSGTLVLGVGKGSGSALGGLFKMGVGSSQAVDIRTRADTASGSDARIIYARMHQYGVGGGEAVRAYAFANAADVATGGTLNGVHASMSVAASSSISGAGNAIRATLEAAAASRTLGGTCAALQLDSNVGANNTVPDSWSFIRVTKSGAVDMPLFLDIGDDQIQATAATGGALKALKVRLADGSFGYINILAAS